MQKFVLSALLLLAFGQASAQLFTIDTIQEKSNNGLHINFPIVHSTQRPDVARNINSHLQEKELHGSKLAPEHMLDYLKENKDLKEYGFFIWANTDKVLTIQIDGSSCSPECVGFETYYNFDVHTGNVISFGEIFREGDFDKLMKLLLPDYRERIKDYITDGLFVPEFEACARLANSMTEFPFEHQYFEQNEIAIKGGQCLHPAGDATKDVDNYMYDVYKLPLERAWWALTEYGLSFYMDQPKPEVLTNTILRGKIDDKYAFTMLLISAGNAGEVTGYEIYNKYLQNINISGKITDNTVTLNEVDASGQPQASFQGSWDGNKFTGNFKNLKTDQVMPFVCER